MSLSGKPIKETYKDLLLVSNSNNGVDDTLRPVLDGEGTVSSLELSSSDVKVNGNLEVSGEIIGSIQGNPDLNWRGEWSASAVYQINDLVYYNGSTYITTDQTIAGYDPVNYTTCFDLFAQQGSDGQAGADGQTGADGASASFEYKGNWDSANTYLKDDVVTYENGSYVATQNITTGSTDINSQIEAENNHVWNSSKNGHYVVRSATDVVGRFVQVLNYNSDKTLSTPVGQKIYASASSSPLDSDMFGAHVAVSDSGTTLSIGSNNRYYYIYELESGNWIAKVTEQTATSGLNVVTDISPDGLKVVFGSSSTNGNAGEVVTHTKTNNTWNEHTHIYGTSTYQYVGYKVLATNDFFAHTQHGYDSFNGAVEFKNWGNNNLIKRVLHPTISEDARFGLGLVGNYDSSGLFNFFVSDQNGIWYRFSFDGFLETYYHDLGNISKVLYFGDNIYTFHNSQYRKYNNDYSLPVLQNEQLSVDDLLFVGNSNSTNFSYLKIGNDISIPTNELVLPSPDSDSNWQAIAIVKNLPVVTSSTRTDGTTVGEQAFESDTNKLIIWNGSAWLSVQLS